MRLGADAPRRSSFSPATPALLLLLARYTRAPSSCPLHLRSRALPSARSPSPDERTRGLPQPWAGGNFRMKLKFFGKLSLFSCFWSSESIKLKSHFTKENGASFLCPSVIYELLISFSEKETCIFL